MLVLYEVALDEISIFYYNEDMTLVREIVTVTGNFKKFKPSIYVTLSRARKVLANDLRFILEDSGDE